MSKRAEEAALKAYPEDVPFYVESQDNPGEFLPVDHNLQLRMGYINGYEQAEKDTTERAIAWLEENVWEHTGFDYSELSDAFCQAMEQEPKNYRVSVKDMIEVVGWVSAKDKKPNPSEWVVVCVKDHGVPQCLALATYNEELDRWFTDQFEDGDREEYFPDYWLRIPNFTEKQ